MATTIQSQADDLVINAAGGDVIFQKDGVETGRVNAAGVISSGQSVQTVFYQVPSGGGTLSTTSDTVYEPTPIQIEVTPKYATSDLIIKASGSFSASAAAVGVKIIAQQSNDGGSTWINADTTGNNVIGIVYSSASGGIYGTPHMMLHVSASTTASRLYRIAFASMSNGSLAYYEPSWGNGMIEVTEVIA